MWPRVPTCINKSEDMIELYVKLLANPLYSTHFLRLE